MADNNYEELFNSDVVDVDGKKIGSIGQVYLDDQTGQPSWVTVKTGWFGLKETFVPLEQAVVADGTITVPYSEDKVKDAPRVDPDKHLDADEEAQLYAYYGIATVLDEDEAAVDAAAPVIADEPVVDEPVAEEPVVEDVVADQPGTDETFAEEVVVDEAAVAEPAVGERFDDVPAVAEPAVDEPALDTDAAGYEAVDAPADALASEQDSPVIDEAIDPAAAPIVDEQLDPDAAPTDPAAEPPALPDEAAAESAPEAATESAPEAATEDELRLYDEVKLPDQQ